MNPINFYDVIIVGGGPAGLTAGIYTARAGAKTLVLEKDTVGGNIALSPSVKNIPGFEEISGGDFSFKLYEQCMEAGAVMFLEEVKELFNSPPYIKVLTDKDLYAAKTVILAVGTTHRHLEVPGEEELLGEHIHFCATCDGPFYTDKTVTVIGGGNSAVTEAKALAKICKKVIILQNLPSLTADKAEIKELENCGNIEIITNFSVGSFKKTPDDKVLIQGTSNVVVDGIFLAVGLVPNNQRFSKNLLLNDAGFAISGLYSNLFLAGDCKDTPLKQVVTACASGAEAAVKAVRYLDEHGYLQQ